MLTNEELIKKAANENIYIDKTMLSKLANALNMHVIDHIKKRKYLTKNFIIDDKKYYEETNSVGLSINKFALSLTEVCNIMGINPDIDISYIINYDFERVLERQLAELYKDVTFGVDMTLRVVNDTRSVIFSINIYCDRDTSISSIPVDSEPEDEPDKTPSKKKKSDPHPVCGRKIVKRVIPDKPSIVDNKINPYARRDPSKRSYRKEIENYLNQLNHDEKVMLYGELYHDLFVDKYDKKNTSDANIRNISREYYKLRYHTMFASNKENE